jgi:hypothetical protein
MRPSTVDGRRSDATDVSRLERRESRRTAQRRAQVPENRSEWLCSTQGDRFGQEAMRQAYERLRNDDKQIAVNGRLLQQRGIGNFDIDVIVRLTLIVMEVVMDRTVSDMNREWRFLPVQTKMQMRIGEPPGEECQQQDERKSMQD